ncbi:MAG TPA: glutamate synthase [Candidatus Thermoplasmatota archaeon]|nr:glutamate synthase [Candidatus Thermoplasmatota archaeon]
MMRITDLSEKILHARAALRPPKHFPQNAHNNEAEGGCGVLGVISSVPIKGKDLVQPMIQMNNRGNGKGGGIAIIGLSSEQMGVSSEALEDDYLILVAYLDPLIRQEVEHRYIDHQYIVESAQKIPTIEDHKSIGLEVKPPEVWRYFVRVKQEFLQRFMEENHFSEVDLPRIEDEFVYRTSYMLNNTYYASLGDKKAFVMSHGKNMMVLKIVGYAEQVLRYYHLEEITAHIWIGHQRYPTKGKIWHPGGSHPFIGLHDALVHNGDFANYHSITEYLQQRNIHPLFLTDTEVAVLCWDLFTRIYRYPLEYVIEVFAPTTERDFTKLPEDKQGIYRALQTTHIHCSPDGPWFFIIGRNEPYLKQLQLLGITDTSMLRPQVFALQRGDADIACIGSEKQAIDTLLQTLSADDYHFRPKADRYWYARGGSYTDGGAFVFTLDEQRNLICTDKFGTEITLPYDKKDRKEPSSTCAEISLNQYENVVIDNPLYLFNQLKEQIPHYDIETVSSIMNTLQSKVAQNTETRSDIIEILTLLIDRRYPTGRHRRSDLIALFETTLFSIFDAIPPIGSSMDSSYYLITFYEREKLRPPTHPNDFLVIDVSGFTSEGKNGTCQFIERIYQDGWRNVIAYRFHGHRNFGAGLITKEKIRIDIYGRIGDCLAAFADGPEFYVHETVQDSVAYCFRSGKLVIYGDVGKTFGYGAKGGVSFILGDLIDRPLINSVGSSTALINGSCKDYMGESCMAARGFIILNGMTFDDHGALIEQTTPYHGGNLFPLAAASCVYLRDPRKTVGEDQLNGGRITSLLPEDWKKILPLLEENERLFGIRIDDLLTVDGIIQNPENVYRKVVPVEVAALTKYDQGI